MDVTLIIHLDWTDAGEPAWWAEAPEISGFTASANSLHELRDVLASCWVDMVEELGTVTVVREVLADAEQVGVRPHVLLEPLESEGIPDSAGGMLPRLRIPAVA